ncbi:peptide ABC transporter substrate-binding protein [Croceicoccus sp. BE223]|uniref:ABC transporter substrate-binding protein n=1 Tax=Croceicoccus sp. BE223 TaxID=2817716 RepID=UPI00285584F4|nr:peptide ABC transporter substrate-binding protein [Croceicoccus sp. BE223]MDR7102836.1 ABC-type transport system substrate-binding protein [Croceicoccus sp. BE223]
MLFASACDGGDSARYDVLLVGDPEVVASEAVPLPSAGALLREATASGIVALDAEGRIQPDLAARWIVTDDGLSYIFRFEDFETDDDKALTALDVRRALRDRIRQLRGSALGLDLSVIDGIYARTDEVIEIRLKTAMPEFLQLLAEPELALTFKGHETGALVLSGEGPVLTLSRPERPGMPAAELAVQVSPAAEAVRRFQDGQAELMLGGDLDALPHVEKGGLLRGTIRLDPVAGMFGLAIAKEEGFLSLAANREALSMAIDRPALIEPFGIGGWLPRARPVPVGPLGTVQPPDLWNAYTIEQRQSVAAQRVRAWAATRGALEPFTVALPPGTGGDILMRRLSEDMVKIGITLKRVGPDDEAQLRLVEEVAWMDRPEWYLHRYNCAVTKSVCDPQADALVAQAIAEPDAAIRAEMLAEAQAKLTAGHVFISFGAPIRFSLVRGGVDGFAVNRWGFHPLSQLFADPI